jgi:transposase-like protein
MNPGIEAAVARRHDVNANQVFKWRGEINRFRRSLGEPDSRANPLRILPAELFGLTYRASLP